MFSRLALFLAKRMPRGYWPLMTFAANRDAALWDFPIPLTMFPETAIRADLRETVSMNFLRHGCDPGQRGHDLVFSRLVQPGNIVFDIGANVGYTMLLFSAFTGPGGKVVAVEPGRRAFAMLARNAEQRSNVRLIRAAASDRIGEAMLYEAAMSDLSSLDRIAGAVEIAVPTITVDHIADEEGLPALVKIDVEGHEAAVLRGMVRLMRSERPPLVSFEALTPQLRGESVATIESSCREGGRFFRIMGDGTVTSNLDAGGTRDYLFVPHHASHLVPHD
jgi:FkbM family methyltransferase